jgi:hypothetical protein
MQCLYASREGKKRHTEKGRGIPSETGRLFFRFHPQPLLLASKPFVRSVFFFFFSTAPAGAGGGLFFGEERIEKRRRLYT